MSRLLAFVFVLLSAIAGFAQAQSLTASPSSLYASQSTTASWSGIASPTGTDWVGLYATSAADNAPVVWQYTDGNASGSGSIAVPNTTVPGSYELRLFAANGYTKLATSNGITVQNPPQANLSAAPPSLYASQSVTATWSTIFSPTAGDWVGLYATSAADNAPVVWQYTNGAASGSAPIVVPNTTAPGGYELRLFSNNGYIKIGTSGGVTVQNPPQANLSASPSSLYASQTVTGTYSSILSPTAADWVGFYAVGAADSAPIAWQYTNGSAAGSTPIVVPNATAAGNYELRLFSNNSYIKIGTSGGVTVNPPPAASLTVSSSASPGGTATATWASILAPTATDWIGLYTPAAADNAFIAWQFTTGSAAGNIAFSIPSNLVPGTYELRLFANNGYTKLATSGSLAVGLMKLSFIQPDHLNTTREIYNQSQQLVWRRPQQEPFGDSPADENPSGLGAFEFDLGFPGQRRDRETGLWYNDQRDGYNAAIGGYTQPEPMGISGDINLYRYARGNPVRYIDPDGRFAFVIPALPAIGTALAEAAVAVAGLVGGAAIANAIQNSSAASEKKKGVEEWNKAVPSMPGLYTCRYVMYFPADQCEDGKCPPFVTGRGYDVTLKGAMAQARQEAQSKIPSGCSHQHHGQMWCRYGSSPPFMP